jgi:hypothetical protein
MTLEPDSQTNSSNIQPASPQKTENLPIAIPPRSLSKPFWTKPVETSDPWLLLTAVCLMIVGLIFNFPWLGFTAAILALMLALQVILPSVKNWILRYLTVQERRSLIGSLSFILAIAGIAKYIGFYDLVSQWLNTFKYDEFGSWAEWVGALGQIMIAPRCSMMLLIAR